MIQVERLQWAGTKPAVVFLIDRSNDPPNDDGRAKLREGYQILFEREQDQYPVRLIQNDASVDESLSQLLEILQDPIPQTQDRASTEQTADSKKQVEQLPLFLSTREASLCLHETISCPADCGV